MNENGEDEISNTFGISADRLDEIFANPLLNDLIRSVEESNARFKDLPAAQKKLAMALLMEGKVEVIPDLWRLFYKRPIASIQDFLKPFYIGDVAGYYNGPAPSPWLKDLSTVFAPDSIIHNWILSGAIGTAKTSVLTLAHFYNTYRINSLRKPQASMGSYSGKPMNMHLMSITLEKAAATIFEPFLSLLRTSQAFQEVTREADFLEFDNDKYQHITPWFNDHRHLRICFPEQIRIVQGSKDFHALGEDLYGASLDEAEFRPGQTVDKVFDLYSSLQERVRSRFRGSKYILMTMASSVQTQTGVMATYIKNLKKYKDPHSYISSYAIWDIKSPNAIRDGGYFYVLRGTKTHPSRVLTDEEGLQVDAKKWVVPAGTEVIQVPKYHLPDFKTNVERSLKNLAGKATVGDEKPFDDLTQIRDVLLAPMVTLVAPLKSESPLWRQLPTELYHRTPAGLKLRRYPTLSRYGHADLGDTGEGGFCVVHKELSITGQVIYVVDFVCKIVSPNRISFELVDEFVIDCQRVLGIHFVKLTADRYQSTGFLQKMEARAVADEVEILSVDQTGEPYLSFSNIVADDSFKVGAAPELEEQMMQIYFDKMKPYVYQGRKDIADACCGAIFNALKNPYDIPTNCYETYKLMMVNAERAIPADYKEIV